MANVTVLVGARPYLLTEQEARRLVQLLRTFFTDETTGEAIAALRLARATQLVLDEDSDEPVEVGWPQARALLRALPEVTAHGYNGSWFCCKRPDGSPTPGNEHRAAR